jgi:ABC-2 type transport system permease protein
VADELFFAMTTPPIHRLTRYGGLYRVLLRNSLMRDMQFKANFILWIFVEMLWFAMQLAFMSVIYSHTDAIAGWTKWQVVLLVGCSHFVQQIFTAFFLSNMTEFGENIRTGRLDFLLLLPVNTRFLLSVRRMDPGALVNAATAIAVIVYALRQLGHVPGLMACVGFLICCVAGVLVHYSLTYLLACIAFWTVRAQGIVWGYYNLFNLARLPESAFPRGNFRRVFTFVLPILLVANVPAKVLLGTMESISGPLLLLLMSGVCLGASEIMWRWSLAHYNSASS